MTSDFFFRVFEHLLPFGSRIWQMKLFSPLRSFFMGLTSLPLAVRNFIDRVWLDTQPQDTLQLPKWETQFGLRNASLIDQEKRDRLDAAWKRTGGQSPRYLQDVMQANGFDVYMHEWWELPAADPPVAHNPNSFLSDGGPTWRMASGNTPNAFSGDPLAQSGERFDLAGFLLVNKILTAVTSFVTAGDLEMQSGDPLAVSGEVLSLTLGFQLYTIPGDPDEWAQFLYWGAETFPAFAVVPAARKDEFEDLLLSICPGEKWLGLLITYA